MTILSDEAVIKRTGVAAPAGVHSTITVAELKELILNSPVVQSYQGANVDHLEANGPWFTNNTLTISITVDSSATP